MWFKLAVNADRGKMLDWNRTLWWGWRSGLYFRHDTKWI